MAGPFFTRNALAGPQSAPQMTGEDEFEYMMRLRDAQEEAILRSAEQFPASNWAPWRPEQSGPRIVPPRSHYDPHETWELLDNMPQQTRRSY